MEDRDRNDPSTPLLPRQDEGDVGNEQCEGRAGGGGIEFETTGGVGPRQTVFRSWSHGCFVTVSALLVLSAVAATAVVAMGHVGLLVGSGDVNRMLRPCRTDFRSYDFCDVTKGDEDRIESLISLLQPAEKIGLMGNAAKGVPRLGLPDYEWWNEGLHGVAKSPGVHFDPRITPNATDFPQVCTLGTTFNKKLFREVASAIGLEARAFFNMGNAGLTYWTPNINIFRDPRWGRGQETPGEDPFLNGEYAVPFVRGLQWGSEEEEAGGGPLDENHHGPFSRLWPRLLARSSPVDPNPKKRSYARVAAGCKHFAAYSEEEGRLGFSAEIHDERDMKDSYLPAFERCVVDGGSLGIMCSYNAINGVPSCANPHLLQDVLRKRWDFQGYVTGDCGAVANVQGAHKYTKDPAETCRTVLESGLDIDCGGFLQQYGLAALEAGQLDEADVDNALRNLFRVQMDMGYFDPAEANPWSSVTTDVVSSPKHGELALEAARQGVVLLKNGPSASSETTLPLKEDIHKSVTLLGPNAKATGTMKGNYFGKAPYLISPLSGLQSILGKDQVLYHKGCGIDDPPSEREDLGVICKDVLNTDATVLVVGLNQTMEAEGHDRTSLDLPPYQRRLVDLVTECAAAEHEKAPPVILVVMSGGPVDLSPYKDDPGISAILSVGYPGQEGGRALAEALYGKFSPSGRLTTTVYPSQYTTEVEMTDMGMRPNATSGNPGRTYRFYTGKTVYPFGHGLSYTKFEYNISGNRTLVQVKVTNSGERDAHDAVLLFHRGPKAGIGGEPLKSLVGFDKVFLKASSSSSVETTAGPLQYDLTNTIVHFHIPETVTIGEGKHTFFVGPSEDHAFTVDGGSTDGIVLVEVIE